MCQIPEKKKEKEHQKSNALANGRKTPKVIIEGEIPRQIRIDEDEEDTNSQGGWTGW